MNHPAPHDRSLEIKVVRELQTDPIAQSCLVAFYALEMSRALGWTLEERFMHVRQAQLMIATGQSRMYTAAFEPGAYIAMLVTTKTVKREIRRLDVLWVAEPYRRQGIGQRLMREARRGGADFHSFATPAAVDWHLANGFRSLGATEEGTVEMFTGSYVPKYSFNYAVPLPTEADMRAMARLIELERQVGKP